jgi:hypothetical protein
MIQEIVKYIIEQDTSEQLDEMHNELARAISLRSAQGMGTDEALNEMLAAVRAERYTRPSSAGRLVRL